MAVLAQRLHNSEFGLHIFREAFRRLQRIGVTLGPNHYYWPVPDFDELARRVWPLEEPPAGVDLAIEQQIDFLQNVVAHFRHEWSKPNGTLFDVGYEHNNGFFEMIDAEIAYSLVRNLKPKRIVESRWWLQQPGAGGGTVGESPRRGL